MRFVSRRGGIWTFAAGVAVLVAGQAGAQKGGGAGDRLFAANKFEAARSAYAAEVRRSPGNTAARISLLQTLLRLDNWQQAVTVGREATARSGGNADTHGLLSLALMRGGQPEAAQKEAARALALNAQSYWGRIAQSRVLIWNARPAEAHKLLASLVKAQPRLPDAYPYLLEAVSDEATPSNETALRDEIRSLLKAYSRLAPKGAPHTLLLEDGNTEETAYDKEFIKDPAFQPSGTHDAAQYKDADEGKSSPVTFTFPIERKGAYIIVPLRINTVSLNLLFDTGAGHDIALGAKAASRVNLRSLGNSFARGFSGKERVHEYKADTFAIGEQTFRSIPLHGTDTELGDIEGLFGGSILQNYAVTVDFTEGTMTLARGKTAFAPPAASGGHLMTVPLHFRHGYPFVPVRVDTRSTWALLDTGADTTTLLSLALARKLAAERDKTTTVEVELNQRLGVGTTDKGFTALGFEFPVDVSLAPASGLPNLLEINPAIGGSMIDAQLSPSFDFDIGAVVGISYLATARRITLDYPHRLLTMEFADSSAE